MKGRSSFAANEIHAIEHTLTEMKRSDRSRRRRLQDALRRRYRFYASDFARGGTLTDEDFERLLAQNVIRVR